MHISEKLQRVLIDINNSQIAEELLFYNGNGNIDYIDISHTDPFKISYITKERIDILKDEYPYLDIHKEVVWKKKRYHAKPGKIITKLFDKKFDQRNIEYFTNYYKGIVEKGNMLMKIVTGGKIRDYFHYSTYNDSYGSLSQSCMRYDETQGLLDMYTTNKNIKMLVALNTSGKLIGRALLWNTIESTKIMDRLYVTKPQYETLFYEWASKNGYHTKLKNNWYDTRRFRSADLKDVANLKLSVKLNMYKGIRYPYLDTFKWLDSTNGIIYNHLPDKHNLKIKTLINCDGKWSPYDALLYDGVSEYYRRKDDVRFCKYMNMWTHKENVVLSDINLDYILKKDAKNSSDFGIIFKNDKFNNKKSMMNNILIKVINMYDGGYLREDRFKYYQKLFDNIEKKKEKETILS